MKEKVFWVPTDFCPLKLSLGQVVTLYIEETACLGRRFSFWENCKRNRSTWLPQGRNSMTPSNVFQSCQEAAQTVHLESKKRQRWSWLCKLRVAWRRCQPQKGRGTYYFMMIRYYFTLIYAFLYLKTSFHGISW